VIRRGVVEKSFTRDTARVGAFTTEMLSFNKEDTLPNLRQTNSGSETARTSPNNYHFKFFAHSRMISDR